MALTVWRKPVHKLTLLSGLLLLLASCADYQFKLNDRVVYTPAPLYTEYNITDEALRECVKQHVGDGAMTQANQLVELNCSHAGVTSLEGIEVFTALKRLKLSSNNITEIGPLAPLANLAKVYLEGNHIRSLLPLRGLEQLVYLNVEGNIELVCAELPHFEAIAELSLLPPKHCSS
jgi:Leucine-rich repeat (LRR) protein